MILWRFRQRVNKNPELHMVSGKLSDSDRYPVISRMICSPPGRNVDASEVEE